MTAYRRTLRMYGSSSEHPPLEWAWVAAQLTDAGLYWVVARTPGHPHPRPVWGVWNEELLHLSIGTPAIRAALAYDPVVTIHLESGTDVVVVEGVADPVPPPATPAPVVAAYDRKYDWTYDVGTYGDLTVVRPSKVLAWRTAGPAGRGSFQATGCWVFGPR